MNIHKTGFLAPSKPSLSTLLSGLALAATLLLSPRNSPAQDNWVNRTPAAPAVSPSARYYSGMAYDTARRQVVLFGGYDGNHTYFSDTWVWDGTNWTKKSPASSPPARGYAAMAYDSAHQQVVLFGGYDGGSTSNDTWVWDGTNWTQKNPGPFLGVGTSMAYDPAHQQVLLFGGFDGSRFLNGTWVWDGTNWTQKSPASSPIPRAFDSMAYDPARQQVVLFGGYGGDGNAFSDTWVWDGTNWTQKPASSPSYRASASIAYDPAHQQVVLFGGFNRGVLYFNDTWVWDGTNWTQKSAASSPSARAYASMVYDPAHQQAMLFGGGDPFLDPLGDTWVLGAPPSAAITHTGNFFQGQTNAVSLIRVGSGLPTTSQVDVAIQPDSNFTVTKINAPNWSCDQTTHLTCSRSDVLVGGTYEAIQLIGSVAAAAPAAITNKATLSGGGLPGSVQATDTVNVSAQSAIVQWGATSNNQGVGLPTSAAFVAIAAGYYRSIALKSDGAIVQWGDSAHNQAVGLPTGGGFVAIAAGYLHNLALKSDGAIVQWGATALNQAVGLPTGGGFVAIAAGVFHNLALKSDGTIVQWGDTANSQTVGLPTGPGFVAIAAGASHNLALKSDGTIVQWGDSAHNQAVGLPTGGGFVAIAAGYYHNLALKSDGTIVQWGDTSSNQAVGLPTGPGFVAIAGGVFHSLALKSDGAITQWGATSLNQAVGLPTGPGFVAIAAGYSHSLALSPLVPITIASTPVGLAFSVTGAGCAPGSYTSPQPLQWTPGSACGVSFSTPQSGGTGTRYAFASWEDSSTNAARSITAPSAATTYTASFDTQYQLSTAVSPAGAGSVSPLSGQYYKAGTAVNLQATANSGYSFVNWTGAVANSTSASSSITLNAPQSVTANFALVTSTTVTNVSGVSGGSVMLQATIAPASGAFTGSLQFQVAGVNAGPAINVTGGGTYTQSYTITQAAGSYQIGAAFTSSASVTAQSSSGTGTLLIAARNLLLTGAPGGGLRQDFSGFVGLKFTVGGAPITVSQLGRWVVNGNSQTHTVKLVNAGGADLPGASVSLNLSGQPAGLYFYSQLAAPITLSANTAYYLVTQEFAGGDQWYDQARVTANSATVVNAAVYQYSGAYTLAGTGLAYGTPNFVFTMPGSQPPSTVSITSPAAGTVSGQITLTASATPAGNLTITSVQFKLDGSNTGPALTSSPYTTTLSTLGLSNALHTLTAAASDSGGNTVTSAPVQISVNNNPSTSGTPFLTGAPATSLRNDYSGFIGMKFTVGNNALMVSQLGRWVAASSSQTHTVKLVNAAGGDIAGGSVSLNLAGATTLQYAYAPLASPLMLSANTSYFLVTQEFAGGDRWLEAGAVNANPAATVTNPAYQSNGAYLLASNTAASYGPSNFIFSAMGGVTQPPNVSITAPADGAAVSGVVGLTASATASTGASVTNVQFKLNGSNIGAAATTSPYTATLDTTTLSNATYTLTAVVTDSASATATSAPIHITVNNSGPVPAVLLSSFPATTPRSDFTGFVGLRFTVGSSAVTLNQLGRSVVAGNHLTHIIKLVGANGVDVPGASATLDLSTVTMSGKYAYVSLPAPVTLNANTSYYLVTQETAGGDQWYDHGPVTASAPVGAVTSSVYQYNGSYYSQSDGSSAYGAPNFTYATTSTTPPPTLNITAPSNGATVTGTVPFSATATAASGLTIVSVQFKVNGGNAGPSLTSAPYTTNFDTTKLSNLTYTLTAVATDSAGNSTTSTPVQITASNPPSDTPLLTGAPSSTKQRNDFGGFVGMQFSVGSSALNVTQLGRWVLAGSSGKHIVKLVDASGVDVPNGSVTVSLSSASAANQYAYATLTTPVTLALNTTYFLMTQETVGGDRWLDYGAVTVTSGAGVVVSAAYQSNGSYSLLHVPNASYGTVNLLFR